MKKILSALLAVAIVASTATLSTFASTSEATLALTAGDLEVVTPPGGVDPELPTIKGRAMDFGTQKITGITNVYPTVGNELVGLIVSDARGEAAAKWDVTVSVGGFTDGTNETLSGFTLSFAPNGTPIPATVGAPNAPTSNAITLGKTDVGGKKLLVSDVAGSPGKWGANWDPTLTVLGGTETTASHTATVTWTVAAVA